MPTVREVEQFLFQLAPRAGAMSWDNVGLLVGDPQTEVRHVLIALDVTETVADEAIASDTQLIIAHHPLMNCHWLPVQTILADTPQGHLLQKLLRAGISVICMHTNLDVAKGGVNDSLAAALKIIDPGPLTEEGLGRVGVLAQPLSLLDFVKFVSAVLGCHGVRYADAGRTVSRVAVGGGACGEYIDRCLELGCDTFVTADLGYHQFLDAVPKRINLIDAGHFPTENVVCATLLEALYTRFPLLQIETSATHREVIQYYVKGE